MINNLMFISVKNVPTRVELMLEAVLLGLEFAVHVRIILKPVIHNIVMILFQPNFFHKWSFQELQIYFFG